MNMTKLFLISLIFINSLQASNRRFIPNGSAADYGLENEALNTRPETAGFIDRMKQRRERANEWRHLTGRDNGLKVLLGTQETLKEKAERKFRILLVQLNLVRDTRLNYLTELEKTENHQAQSVLQAKKYYDLAKKQAQEMRKKLIGYINEYKKVFFKLFENNDHFIEYEALHEQYFTDFFADINDLCVSLDENE